MLEQYLKYDRKVPSEYSTAEICLEVHVCFLTHQLFIKFLLCSIRAVTFCVLFMDYPTSFYLFYFSAFFNLHHSFFTGFTIDQFLIHRLSFSCGGSRPYSRSQLD